MHRFQREMTLPGMRGLKPGFSIGAYMSMKFPKQRKWQLEIDMMYSTRGNRSKFYNTLNDDINDDVVEKELKYNIQYLEIPILFRYMLNRGGEPALLPLRTNLQWDSWSQIDSTQ